VALGLASLLSTNRVIPVAQFDDRDAALRTAELLLKHSMTILEITFRTANAAEILHAVATRFPGLTVGAGSVLSADAMGAAVDAGAAFCVAPGFDPSLVEKARSRGCGFIPGVATPTEINAALKVCDVIKLFPAAQLGGVEYIKAVTAPFKTKQFHLVPTGGVNRENFLEYLKQDRVISVGMSWVVDGALIKKGDFDAVEGRIADVMRALA
jgi:2-dehydro-3-deoxyphosphogluconate aldolase / (4S)-4-hydroxy-2-oxoglutarate aldolase